MCATAASKIPVVILGAVGTSLNIARQINCDHNGRHRVIGWCVDNVDVGATLNGLPVVAHRSTLRDYLKMNPEVRVLFNMYKQGEMEQRLDLLLEIGLPDTAFTNYVHSTAYVSEDVELGVGNVVFPNASIASGVNLGKFNIINYNVVIEHHTILKIGNFLASGSIIGSHVKLEDCNFIGLGAQVREKTILSKVMVGMGAVVLNDFSSCTIIGTPARPLGLK
jgi:acetyltransferase-like isoleucine patch superfamily enzyme